MPPLAALLLLVAMPGAPSSVLAPSGVDVSLIIRCFRSPENSFFAHVALQSTLPLFFLFRFFPSLSLSLFLSVFHRY